MKRFGKLATDDDAGVDPRALAEDVPHRGIDARLQAEIRPLVEGFSACAAPDDLVGRQIHELFRVLEVGKIADFEVVLEIDDVTDRLRIDATHERAGGVGRRRAHRIPRHDGSCGTAARANAHPRVFENRFPVLESSGRFAVDHDVRVVAEDLALQIVSEAAHDRGHRTERARTDRDACHRKNADRRKKAALRGADVTRTDERDEGSSLERIERHGQERSKHGQEEENPGAEGPEANDLIP